MKYLVPLLALFALAGCDMMNMGTTTKDTPTQIINDDPGSRDDAEMPES